MTKMMDITPTTHMLHSIRASKGPNYLLFGEACDNSFDAGASSVDIISNTDGFVIKDDGIGITKERESAIFTLGKHASMGTTQLGRYGVGITDRAASAGDTFIVTSISADGHMRGEVSWTALASAAEWSMPEPTWNPKRTSPTGATLQIRKLTGRVPSDADNRRSIYELAQIYRPALVGDKKITFNGDPIPILKEPKLDGVVEAHIAVSGSKGADVRAGVILESKPDMHEVYVACGFRNVKVKSNFGCAGFSAKRMYCAVTLIGKWGLSKFKNQIIDDDLEHLEDEVHKVIRPILDRLQTESMTVELEDIISELNAMLPEEIAASRPDRKRTLGRIGSKDGRRGTHEKEEPSGPARTKRPPRNQLRIDFEDGDDEYGIGRLVEGRPNVVQLSKDNAYIAGLMRDRNAGSESASPSLYVTAISIYDEWARRQGDLFQEEREFGLRVARFLKRNVAYESAA